MLLVARALGLDATLTALYFQFEKEAEAALGLPPGVHSYALLPIGYPMGRLGPVRPDPLADVVYEDGASLAAICSGPSALRGPSVCQSAIHRANMRAGKDPPRFPQASCLASKTWLILCGIVRKGEPNRRDNRWISIRRRNTPTSVRATGLFRPVFHALTDQHLERKTC
jgi:hypothetical protein